MLAVQHAFWGLAGLAEFWAYESISWAFSNAAFLYPFQICMASAQANDFTALHALPPWASVLGICVWERQVTMQDWISVYFAGWRQNAWSARIFSWPRKSSCKSHNWPCALHIPVWSLQQSLNSLLVCLYPWHCIARLSIIVDFAISNGLCMSSSLARLFTGIAADAVCAMISKLSGNKVLLPFVAGLRDTMLEVMKTKDREKALDWTIRMLVQPWIEGAEKQAFELTPERQVILTPWKPHHLFFV